MTTRMAYQNTNETADYSMSQLEGMARKTWLAKTISVLVCIFWLATVAGLTLAFIITQIASLIGLN